MSKKPLFIGAIASIIAINSVFADTTVTSRNYVDTQVATKQNKIDATGANFTIGSVVETTSTPGVVTQRGIFNPRTDFDYENNEVASGHEGDLVTAGLIVPAVNQLYQQMDELPQIPSGPANTVAMYNDEGVLGDSRGIYDGSTTYDSSTDADKLVTASVVQNVSNNLPTITTSKMTCVDSPDCTLWSVADQTVYGQCKAYGETVTDADECCSGVLNGSTCGCASDRDCTTLDNPVCNTHLHYCHSGGPK